MATNSQASPKLLPVEDIRAQFPGLSPDVAALDGAAGTQVPTAVVHAVVDGLRAAVANTGGSFVASRRSTAVMAEAR